MNVTELARKLRVHPKKLLDILPEYGFDIGARAIKVDDKTAVKIMRQWKRIIRDMDEKKRRVEELEKQKQKEFRKQSGETVTIPEIITVRELADILELPVTQVITELMKNGVLANQNQNIDYDTAMILSEELGFTVNKRTQEETVHVAEVGEELKSVLDKGDQKVARPPVIVVMGHVDHGKTRLLDTIREANIIDTEAGGITQHIGAYQTVWKDPKTGGQRALTFIDTPGHEAFTVMRSRGATVADLAIIVVAADDSVKPQTEEVIQIVKAAKLPFVVAINKIDKDTADVDKVKGDLARFDLIPEDWGGNTPMIGISAKEKINIDQLLDVLLLVADMNAADIEADPTIPAVGTIIESHVDKSTGPVATVLVQAGTLRKGDLLIVNGEIYGKVRAMRDYTGMELEEAGPSIPAQIVGFKVAPEVGDVLDVGMKGAKKIDIKQKRSQQTGAQKSYVKKKEDDDEEGEGKKYLKLLIKSDVLGSLEAIIGSLERIHHDEVGVKIVGKGLGNIMADDVNKAESAGAHVIGFHVKPTPNAEEMMGEKDIDFRRYEVIYDLINWVKEELGKLLEDEKIVHELGRVKVLKIFRTDKQAMTVGGRVEDGHISPRTLVRVKRDGDVIGEGKITKCQTGTQEVKKVPSGTECGIRYEGKVKIEEGDVLEVYKEESKIREIQFEE